MADFSRMGAALMVEELEPHLEWLKAGKRDLEIQDFSQVAVLDSDWQTVAENVTSALEGFEGRMGIHGPFWGLDIANLDPILRKATSKRLLQGLDAAEQVGATHMVIHSPVEPWMHRHIMHDNTLRTQVIGVMRETLAPVLEKAESIGCCLVMENIRDLEPRLQVELIHAMNSDAIRMSIDIGHTFIMQRQNGAPTPDRFVAEAGNLLEHVHIQDTDGFLDRHWLAGQGDINFEALFEELAKLEDMPRLIIEVRQKDKIQENAAWLLENFAR